jgi:hypothetical protein
MGDLYTKPMAKASSLRRGLSPTIWSQAPITEINNGGLTEGFGFTDDFLTFDDASNSWFLTNASSGTAALDVAAKGGVLLLDSAAAANNQGVQIQMGGEISASSFIASAVSKIYYEARVKIADIGSTTCQMFVGLSSIDTSILASAANTSINHIGFEAINDTAMGFHSEKADTRASTAAVHTVVDDAYVKLGFVVDGLTKVTPYVNGVAKAAITTQLPIVGMTPSFVCHSSGTTDPIVHVDWVACYQVEQIAN